ncbi:MULTISPECIES: hypothetical protein [unclassified Microcoleus]|uniref:hypothetical protein n=1 Tax=unclassified Microcoleus TaxID=2642155 RepID=UPI002FD0B509
MGTDEDSHIQVVRSRLRSRLSEIILRLNQLCRLDAETLPAFDRANCTIRQLAIVQQR